MKQRIIVIGGGYAGIQIVNALLKQFAGYPEVQITLVDKESYHLRKVLLFQGAVEETPMKVPFTSYFGGSVEVIQAELSSVDPNHKQIILKRPDGLQEYDRLILCLGSTVLAAAPEQGGVSLTDISSSRSIRIQLEQNIADARLAIQESERRRLLTVAVVGGGITGIETASELVYGLRRKAAAAGLDPALASVTLINAQDRLLGAAPPHVSAKLEKELSELGVQVRHGARAEVFREGALRFLQGGKPLPVGACVWTLGLRPNPLAGQLGLPLHDNGKLAVDARYHIQGSDSLYAIGDCAHVVDPLTGHADGMTCKEAIPQAARLARIIKAEMAGVQGPTHASYMTSFCIGLGPEKGFIWIQKWGMNIMLTGKLGRQIRQVTWDIASLMSRKITSEVL